MILVAFTLCASTSYSATVLPARAHTHCIALATSAIQVSFLTLLIADFYTQRAPSSFNLQPTQIILVQDQRLKDQLAAEAMLGQGNQYRTRDCSALAVFLADLQVGKRVARIQALEKRWGHRHPTYSAMMPLTTSFLLGEGHAATLLKSMATRAISEIQPMPTMEPIETWSYKNTSLAVQSYTLAATSYDLATAIMEGFDARRAKEVLRIPDRYGIPMMVATGYDFDEHGTEVRTPRLPLDEVVFGDTFGAPRTGATPSGRRDEQDDPAVASV
jgi:nitroreductase